MSNDITRENVVHRVLERQAVKYGDRTFLCFHEEEYSFKAFDDAASRVACGLQRLGIAKGDKVAIVMDNCPEFLFLWFGLSKLGAVEVPLNTAHKGDILAYMLDQSDSCVVVVHSHYVDRVGAVLGQTPKIRTVVDVGPGAGPVRRDPGGDEPAFRAQIAELGKQVVDWADLVDNDGRYEPADVTWSDPYAIMYTSGTTGLSKGVMLPYNPTITVIEGVSDAMEIDDRDCIYTYHPLFHNAAQTTGTVLPLLAGARMVLTEKFSARTFWDDIRRYGCTESLYTGSILPMLLNAEAKPDDADNPLRVMLGVAATKEVFEAFEKRFGVMLLETYGSSEITIPIMNSLKGRKSGSCGNLHPEFVAKIVDDDGMEVGPDIPGELLIRPLKPYTMLLQYYNMPEKTVEAWRDLWFHTGDCLRLDEDGFFYFVDRKKDALRRRGENISSFELERAIDSHPAVLESAVVAAKSELGEDEVLACVRLKPGESLAPLDLTMYCEERMAYFMVPRYIRFVDSFPKTPTLRVEKYKLRQEGVTPDTWDREKTGYKLRR